MNRTQVSTEQAPRPAGAYSQGIVANGLLHTAGLGPQDPVSGTISALTIEEQTRQVMRNLSAVLAAHGLDFRHVVKTTVHLSNLRDHMPGFNATYEEFVVPPHPVRTTVGSALGPRMLVEVDALAVANES